MERNKNYGEKFWDDVITNSSSNSSQTESALSYTSGGVDILQQSLEEAQIVGGSANNDPLDFDDFGFSFSNSELPQSSLLSSDNGSLHTSNNDTFDPDDFDVTEFLNLTSSSTKTNVTNQAENKTTTISESSTYDTTRFVNSPLSTSSNTVVNQQQLNSQFLPGSENASFQKQEANSSAGNIRNATKPVTYIQLQLPGNDLLSASKQVALSAAPQNTNTQYVLSRIQTAAPPTNVSYTVHAMSSVQTTTPAVCASGSTNSFVSSQTGSTPLVFTLNTLPNQMVNQSVSNEKRYVQTQPVTPKVSNPSIGIGQVFAGLSHNEQADKLAHLLQTKAISQGTSKKLLRFGNQTIDISDPTVAKMVASKLLQQQKQPQTTTVANAPVGQYAKRNIPVTVLNISGLQNNSNTSAMKQQQLPPQFTSIPTNISTQNNLVMETTQNHSISPSLVHAKNAYSPLVYSNTSKSASPVPINRIQIASVNISRTLNSPTITMQRQQTSVHQVTSASSFEVGQKLQHSANTLPSRNEVIMSTHPSTTAAASVPNALIQHMGTTKKLNTVPQLTSNLTKEQLQKLVAQHQAVIQARNNAMGSSKPITVNNQQNVTTKTDSPVQSATSLRPDHLQEKVSKILTFRVDPNLTAGQVDEVQQIICKKLPLSKVNQLTHEQKQLLSAFRAQIRAMTPTIQQYYLRNPHLFLQKVYQHLQSGKPFLCQVKVEQLNTSQSSIPTSSNLSSRAMSYTNDHPTITLSGGSRQKVQTTSAATTFATTAPTHRKVLKRPGSHVPEVNKGQFPVPAKRPSLVFEQLQKHCELAVSPNMKTPFKNIRDAFRRLLPYHVFNTPEIAKEKFDESEAVFEKVSEKLTSKASKMLKKYHLLCLKDASMDVHSADMVMLERAFLQHEKSAFADAKQSLADDPDALLTFLPASFEEQYPTLVPYLEDRINSKLQLPSPSNNGQTRQSETSHVPSGTRPVTSNQPIHDNAHLHSIHRSPSPTDILLQEAVESIL